MQEAEETAAAAELVEKTARIKRDEDWIGGPGVGVALLEERATSVAE